MIKDLRSTPQKKERLILSNCIKMLMNRGLLSAAELSAVTEEALSQYDDLSHSLDMSLPGGTDVRIRMFGDKISTLNKISGLVQFLENHPDDIKIIVVEDIQPRPFKEMIEYPRTEVFRMREFVINPIEHVLMPTFRPLSEEEKGAFMKEYAVRLKDLPRIEKVDYVVRYFNLKVGDVIEIIRPSIASGESVSYRIVSNCSWDKLFA